MVLYRRIDLKRGGALALMALAVGCGHGKSGSGTAAATAPASGVCGVQMAALTSNLGVGSPEGWSKALPIAISFSAEFSATELAQINRALDTWEAATGLTLFQRNPTPDPETGASFPTLDAPLSGSVNLFFKDSANWAAHTGKDTTILGTTVYDFIAPDQLQLMKASIRYDYDNWKIGDTTVLTDANAADLESIALHEAGHFLGLAHLLSQPSIMTPTVFVGPNAVARQLFHVDVANIRSIYTGGKPVPSTFTYAD